MIKRIYLEITDACNLNCPFCTVAKGGRFLSLADFDDFTRQIKEFTDYIYLHVLGEPLLHPQFEDFLKILDDRELKLQLVTNGTLLERYPALLDHKCLRKLSISVHSLNGYELAQSCFRTIDALLVRERECVIELRFYDTENKDERIRDYHDSLIKRYGLKEMRRAGSHELFDKTYICYEKLFRWPDINDEIIDEEGYCHGLKDQLAILSNGIVTSCCLDPKGINELGDMKRNSLKEILESDKYLKARKDLADHRLTLPLCGHCTYRQRFDRKRN